MKETPDKVFLIDGFPREMDQCLAFEEQVCRAQGCIFMDVVDRVLEERLLERGKVVVLFFCSPLSARPCALCFFDLCWLADVWSRR